MSKGLFVFILDTTIWISEEILTEMTTFNNYVSWKTFNIQNKSLVLLLLLNQSMKFYCTFLVVEPYEFRVLEFYLRVLKNEIIILNRISK